MTSAAFEVFLTRLYVDKTARDRFLKDRSGEASRAGLSPGESEALLKLNAEDLLLAANSFERKRRQRQSQRAGFLNQILDCIYSLGRH